MILYEFEGKRLLSDAGIAVPRSQLLTNSKDEVNIKAPLVLKAQVLSGKRADAGGVIVVGTDKEVSGNLSKLFSQEINGEKVSKVLVEERIDFDKEYYVSISHDAEIRGPVLTISESGGTGIEERKVHTFPLNVLDPTQGLDKAAGLEVDKGVLGKLVNAFFELDCELLEVNPLVKDREGKWIALDAKINLDDSALGRHEDWKFPPRSAPGHVPTEREIQAKKIDEGDYRGVAGSTYFDLDGDIAILASGGGASLTAMDALLAAGGKPSNYTEYGGNPPREKVEKLTKIVLSKPDLHGLWVVGAIANFTDIYETLSGFVAALRKVRPRPRYPIVIRRGGPRDKEAFEMLKKVKEFDLHLYGEETSITKSAEVMTSLAKKYATSS